MDICVLEAIISYEAETEASIRWFHDLLSKNWLVKLEVRNRHHVKNAEKGLFAVKIWPQSAKPIRQVAHNIVVKKKKKKKNYVTSLICLTLRGISLRWFPSTCPENLADNKNVIKRERVTVLVNHAEQCLRIRLFCPFVTVLYQGTIRFNGDTLDIFIELREICLR